jgi:hypothetical protein
MSAFAIQTATRFETILFATDFSQPLRALSLTSGRLPNAISPVWWRCTFGHR